MYVIPRDDALEKLAAVQYADTFGRQLAQDQAVEKLAEMAGVFMANTQTEESMDKLAQSMVFAGELSLEEYEMLKEAGFGGLLAKRVGKSVKGALSSAGQATKGALSGVKSRAGKVVSKPVMSRQSRDWGARAATAAVPGRVRMGAGQSRDWVGKAPVKGPVRASNPARATKPPVGPPRAAPAQGGAPGQVVPSQAAPVSPAMREGRVVRRASTRGAAQREGRVVRRVRNAGVVPQQNAPVVEMRRPRAAASPGQVAPAAQQSPGWVADARAQPGSQIPKPGTTSDISMVAVGRDGKQYVHRTGQQPAGKVAPAAEVAQKAAPTAVQQAATTDQAASSAQTPNVAPEGKKGKSWGGALPWMGVGGLGYGLYKGVPWAARQLEASSTTPLAYGGGWSPVPYGYGHSPYGAGMPTLGRGA